MKSIAENIIARCIINLKPKRRMSHKCQKTNTKIGSHTK